MATVDPFRPGRFIIILRGGGRGEPEKGFAVVPGHPGDARVFAMGHGMPHSRLGRP